LTDWVKNGKKRGNKVNNGKKCVESDKTGARGVIYSGQVLHSIDPSRRVMIPKKWRSDGAEFWALPWPIAKKECLLVVPAARFHSVLERLSSMSLSSKSAALVERVIGGTSECLELDKAGRICLPEAMTAGVGIKDQALFVGRMNKFEIWEPERFKAASQADEALAAAEIENMNL
jgi:MraZ protein